MYKVNTGGEAFYSEAANPVKTAENGSYILCGESEREGYAVDATGGEETMRVINGSVEHVNGAELVAGLISEAETLTQQLGEAVETIYNSDMATIG